MSMNYDAMSLSQLAIAFNAMVEQADKIGQNAIKNVKRFKSRDAGIKRCKWLDVKLHGETTLPKKSKLDRWYGIGAGSLRDRLRLKLQSVGGPVTERECIAAVYGKEKGAIGGVIKGLKVMLEKQKAPFKIVESRNEKEEKCLEIVSA